MREHDGKNLSWSDRLRVLPEADPPRDAWPAIRARLEKRRRRPVAWPGLALAASVILAVSLWIWQGPESPPPAGGTPWLAQSQELEQELRRLRNSGGVMNGGEAALVAELEDRITVIDMQLAGGELSESEAEKLWRRRVALLAELVAVRSDRVAVVEADNYVL